MKSGPTPVVSQEIFIDEHRVVVSFVRDLHLPFVFLFTAVHSADNNDEIIDARDNEVKGVVVGMNADGFLLVLALAL